MIFLIYLCLIFNLIFPKSGLKLEGIPIYLGVIMSLIMSLILYKKIMSYSLNYRSKEQKFLLITSVILVFNFFIPIILNFDYLDYVSIIIQFFGIVVYPTAYFLPKYYPEIRWIRFLKITLIVILIYGLLQKIFGDYTVVIPGLTANYQESIRENFLGEKHNMLHNLGVLKMTSTYQNGNLFGLNLTLIFWTVIKYFNKKSKVIWSLIFMIAIIMTGSASSYIANILIISLIILYETLIKKKYWPLIISVVGILLSTLIILKTPLLLNILETRFLNRDLASGGGRIENLKEQVTYISNLWNFMLGSATFNQDIGEMILTNTLIRFGILGVFLFFIRFMIFISFKVTLNNYIGIVAFLINSFFDSAINYPPVYFNYFLILGIVNEINIKIKNGYIEGVEKMENKI